jgi:three-Cys-motif partner protein
MAIDFANYAGREQAFVKHTFLDKYLPALVGRIASKFDEFVYVDGFAGPWKSAAGETFEDTSFGIALRHMTEQQAFWSKRGRHVRMRAFLVELDPVAYAQLLQAVAQFPSVEITPLNGRMEAHAGAIAASIPRTAFSFSLIDPKGFPQIGALKPLLTRPNSETLVNFMFDFANRFAGKDLIPALEDWLSATKGEESWRAEVAGLAGIQREEKIESLAAESLRLGGGYTYAPVISVDKVLHDRTLYKLILLSRRVEGLKVFRDCQCQALSAQAKARSAVKAKVRASATAMSDLFAEGEDAIPHDRSSKMMQVGEERARAGLSSAIQSAEAAGIRWIDIWPTLLTAHVVTHSTLGRHANELRKSAQIAAPSWPSERTQIPKDEQRFVWVGQ